MFCFLLFIVFFHLRTNRVIKQIFETEKYDLILQEAVFWSPKVDITDKVIKALNAQGGK